MAQDSLFKLQSYQRTQQLIRDVNFENAVALPSAAGAEGVRIPNPGHSNSWIINRVQDSIAKNDMTLAAHTLRDITDILEYRAKNIGEKPESNPLYDFYRRLRDQAESGRPVSWEELSNALNTFSADSENLTALQDTINNEKLNASSQGVSEEEIEKNFTTQTDNPPITYQPIHDQPPPISIVPEYNTNENRHQEHHEEEHTSHTSNTSQAPSLELPEQTQRKLNQANRSIQQSQSSPAQTREDQTASLENKLNRFNKSMRKAQPSRETLLNSRTRKKAAASLLKTSPSTGSGGILGAANNYLAFRDLINGGRWLADKLGLRGLSNFLGRFLAHENLIARALQGLWNLGASFARSIFDGLIRSVLPRSGFSALSGAGGTIGSWLTGAGAVIGSIGFGTILVWAVVIFSAIFFIFAVYDSNTECGQPGKVELNKTATDSNGAVKENFEPNQQINYKITLNYNIKCSTAYLDRVEVKDIIPPSLTYQANSAKSSKVAEIPQTPTEIDDPFFEENGADTLPGQIDPEFPAADDIRLDGNILTWRLGKVPANTVITMTFSATPNQTDTWISNQATAGYTIVSRAGLFSGNLTDATGLLPNPLPPPPENWESVKSQIIAAFNKHPELIDIYKQGSAEAGVPWQVLAGLHFVETGSGPGPDSSLVSGRKIGQMEPDINPSKCAAGRSGPGVPVPIDGGCGFTNQLDSAIYASHHLAEKIGKPPSTFAEAVEVVSRYNGGGNANCGEGLDYGPCPPQFYGEDDPYAMADFDEPHSSKKMYLIFCGDRQRCNARIFDRPGAMAVVRALVEEGF